MTDVTVIDVTQSLNIQVQETSTRSIAVDSEPTTELHVETSTRTLTVEAEPAVELYVAAAGIQGPPGPQGPVGAPGGSRFNYTRDTPAPVWSIQHNLGYEPLFSTVIVDGSDVTDGADIFHIDNNSLTISFSAPVSGRAAFI